MYGPKNLFDDVVVANSSNIFIGIDPSLSNTGLVGVNERGELCFAINMKYALTYFFSSKLQKESLTSRIYAIIKIYKDILSKFLRDKSVFIMMEDYAYGGTGHLTKLGELSGIIKFTNFLLGVNTHVVSIKEIKKFATGRGDAQKDTVLKKATSDFPEVPFTTDTADAYFISYMCYTLHTNTLINTPHSKHSKEDMINKFNIINNLKINKYHVIENIHTFNEVYNASKAS